MIEDIISKIRKLKDEADEISYKMIEAEGDDLFFLEDELILVEESLNELEQEKEAIISNEYSMIGE